jgi:oligopeptide/dipeptide ABC transporter ATP-binding protein
MTTGSNQAVNKAVLDDTPVLQMRDVSKQYVVARGWYGQPLKVVSALAGVSLDVQKGETVAIVGESGSGKSTMGRIAVNLLRPTGGDVRYDGQPAVLSTNQAMLRFRKQHQIVFQDPRSSLNPRRRLSDILGDPLILHGVADRRGARGEAGRLLEQVGLAPGAMYLDRKPPQFSGGQLQRIAVARALSLDPKLVVADEPVSALDASVRAQVLQLIHDQQQRTGVSFLFITHDLAVARNIAHRIAVMYLGKLVEIAPVEQLLRGASHPYTQALLSATPLPDPRRERARVRLALAGEIPSPANPPSGCRFHTRCPQAMPECRQVEPMPRAVGDRHTVACHLYPLEGSVAAGARAVA